MKQDKTYYTRKEFSRNDLLFMMACAGLIVFLSMAIYQGGYPIDDLSSWWCLTPESIEDLLGASNKTVNCINFKDEIICKDSYGQSRKVKTCSKGVYEDVENV